MSIQLATWVEHNKKSASWIEDHAKPVIGSIAGLAASVIALLPALNIVHWSAGQTALVSAEAAAVLGLVTAVVTHFWPGTSKEPVALAATLTAWATATCALGGGFAWWQLTEAQSSALVAVVAAAVGVIGAVAARSKVHADRTV